MYWKKGNERGVHGNAAAEHSQLEGDPAGPEKPDRYANQYRVGFKAE